MPNESRGGPLRRPARDQPSDRGPSTGAGRAGGAGLEFRPVGGWQVATLTLPPGQSGDLACLRCGSPVELHQPDPERPALLLGTCGACGAWHLIAATAAGMETMAVGPPDEAGPEPPHGLPS